MDFVTLARSATNTQKKSKRAAAVGETLPKGSWKSIRVGCKRENYSFLFNFCASTVNNELPIKGLRLVEKIKLIHQNQNKSKKKYHMRSVVTFRMRTCIINALLNKEYIINVQVR